MKWFTLFVSLVFLGTTIPNLNPVLMFNVASCVIGLLIPVGILLAVGGLFAPLTKNCNKSVDKQDTEC